MLDGACVAADAALYMNCSVRVFDSFMFWTLVSKEVE